MHGIESFTAMEFGGGDTGDHVCDGVSSEGVGEDAGEFRVTVRNVSRCSTASRELRDYFSEGGETSVDRNTFFCAFSLGTSIPVMSVTRAYEDILETFTSCKIDEMQFT